MIIDFHTHAFPDKLADRAMKILSGNSGLDPFTDGTVKGLINSVKEGGADICVVQNIATNESQQKNVNDFAASVNGKDIIAFGSVFPLGEEALEELERISELGLKGIKFHPDYQGFFVDDERVFPVYEKAAELGLITLFHCGVDLGLPEPTHCTPERLSRVLPVFFGKPVVAAHMGGYLMWDEVERYLVGRDVYLDTAFCYSRIPLPQMRRITDAHGTDKILFGSDQPWSSTGNEMRLINALSLPLAETEAILGGNAVKLLDI